MSTQTHQVEFHGKAGEYFGIWFVNILLTVLTIGIYSAWAKVRTRRYFYGNTTIDEQAFDYHAKPMQILIGRLIVVGVLIVFNLIASIFPLFVFVVLPLYVGLLPWLIVRATRFNSRMTSYRNVRFDFDGRYGQAFIAFMLLPLTIPLTFGLTIPVVTRAANTFIANGSRYGDRPFALTLRLGPIYSVFFAIYGLAILSIVLIIGITIFLAVGGSIGLDPSSIEEGGSVISVLLVGSVYLILPVFAILGLVYTAAVRNIVYGELELDNKHHFSSTLGKRRYAWIIVSNVIVTVLTVGLMRPWAAIRLARYVASQTQVIAGGPLDVYSSSVRESSGVVAGEYFDIEGIDVGAAV